MFFVLFLYVPSTIFQLNRGGSSRVEPVLSEDKCVLLKDHNAVTPMRLEPAAPRSRFKHSTTEPLRSRINMWVKFKTRHKHYIRASKSKDPDVKIHYKRFRAHVKKVLRDAY